MTIGNVTIDGIDVLLILYFAGFFVLGFAQGTIRRLLGIGSILFSWFLAANLAKPLSEFLGANWTQFPKEYSYMSVALMAGMFSENWSALRTRTGPRSSLSAWVGMNPPPKFVVTSMIIVAAVMVLSSMPML